MSEAQEIVRAREDLLLADTDRMRAIAAILPQINFGASAGEAFYGDYYVEARSGYFGPFPDREIHDTWSQPAFSASISGRQLIWDGGRWWTVLARSTDIRAFRVAAVQAVGANLRL